ncbi:unnamed protein product, partial [Laminaria digitata]
ASRAACKYIQELGDQLAKTGLSAGQSLLYVDMHIENNGNSVAKRIRLAKSSIKLIEVGPNEQSLKTLYADADGVFSIPDLNPGEELIVKILDNSYYSYSDYSFEKTVPNLTYDGGKVEVLTLK